MSSEIPSPDSLPSITLDPIYTAIILGVAALIAVFFGGFKKIVATCLELAELKLRRKYANGIQSIAIMYKTIENAKRLNYIDRILLFSGKNCGGIPTPPKPFHVSCFFGWSNDATKDPLSYYNFNISVDVSYMTMLQECIKLGVSRQTTAKMSDDSMLKSFYMEEGVKDSLIIFLYIDPQSKELYYCSFGNYKREFTNPEIHSIKLIAERMKTMIGYKSKV